VVLAPGLTPAIVTKVVDGDTIYVSIDGNEQRLRYIGIDTPELAHFGDPVECLAKEATQYNERLVLGRTVGLEKDVSETDDFGRLLRYVWLGDEMVNARLVAEGYANAATYPPDVRYAEMLASLQAQARTAGRGLWGSVCEDTTPQDE
jgi:micrococcal nuclease